MTPYHFGGWKHRYSAKTLVALRLNVTKCDNILEVKTTLRTLREARGWTQRELGSRAGVSGVAIQYLETGQRHGQIDTWQKIATALGEVPAEAQITP